MKIRKRITIRFSWSIKTQLILWLGTLILTICVGMGLVSYTISADALTRNTDQILPQMAAEAAMLIESRIQGNFDVLAAVAELVGDQKLTKEQRTDKLKGQETRGEYLLLGIADQNGALVTSGNKSIDISSLEVFQKAAAGENAVSEPMPDIFGSNTSNLIVIYALPLKNGEADGGVLIAVDHGNEFSLLVNDIVFGSSGNSFMVNRDGSIIAHSNYTLVFNKINFIKQSETDRSLKPLAETLQSMTEGKSGTGSYVYEGVKKYAGYAPIPSTGWSIAVSGARKEILSGLGSLQISVLILSLVFIIAGVVFIFILSGSITKGLTSIMNNISLMAGGDLSREVSDKLRKKKDEIGILAQSFTVMQGSVRDMIYNIMDSNTDIKLQSANLSAISQEMSGTSDHVTLAIQEVAKGAGAQAEDLSVMMRSLGQFAEELEHIVTAIKEIDGNVEQIGRMSENSSREMLSLVASSDHIQALMIDFIGRIQSLNNHVKKINEITNYISEIAGQTNLLALNASIEAARAGEYGRGFAVVAEQIRKLAEQTKASSANINSIIEGVSRESSGMTDTTEILNSELDSQSSITNTAIASFEKILQAIKGIIPEIEEVNHAAMELNDQKKGILEKIEGVASIAEEVSASSEEIASSSQEMNASLEEVAAAARMLSNRTGEMMEQVNRFKISDQPERGAVTT